MTSKERVHAALCREPVDRVPIFMWLHPGTANRLGTLLELPPHMVADALGNDVHQAWVGNNYAMEGIVHETEGESHVDAWGIEWTKIGPFNQISRSPLEHADTEALRSYAFPYHYIGELLMQMEPLLQHAGTYFIGCDVSPCIFEMICRIRGMENAILDFSADPVLAEELIERTALFEIALAEAACERWPLDWLWTGDDVAGQQAMIMNPSLWRSMIRPRLSRIVDVGKKRKLWAAYHCCGSLRPIIPDLIEMGVDVLNPVQGNCPGMDPLELKREFGRNLAFMGGLDTQELLPKGSTKEVFRETSRLIEGMSSDGGGYILSASHTIPPETPLENVFAIYEAAGVSHEEICDRASDIRRRDPLTRH